MATTRHDWDQPNPTISPSASEDLRRFGLEASENGHGENMLAQFRWMKRMQAKVDELTAQVAALTAQVPNPALSRKVAPPKDGE